MTAPDFKVTGEAGGLDLDDLVLLERVAQERSISRAAAALNLPQPTATARLRSLEGAVGRPLFERSRRGVELTPAGEAYLERALRALALLREGQAAARAAASGPLRLTVGATAASGAYLLPPVLQRLAADGMDVAVHTGHSHQVLSMLLDGLVDVGVVIAAPVQAGVLQRRVHRSPVVAVASPDHPLAGQLAPALADLQPHPLALVNWGPGYDEFVARLEAALGAPPRGLIKVSPVEAAKALAVTGHVTFLPEIVVRAELGRGELVPLPLADLGAWWWDLSAIYRDRKQLAPTVAAFLAQLPPVR